MFHLSLQKDRNIPTLYEKKHDILGHPVHAERPCNVTTQIQIQIQIPRELTVSLLLITVPSPRFDQEISKFCIMGNAL